MNNPPWLLECCFTMLRCYSCSMMCACITCSLHCVVPNPYTRSNNIIFERFSDFSQTLCYFIPCARCLDSWTQWSRLWNWSAATTKTTEPRTMISVRSQLFRSCTDVPRLLMDDFLAFQSWTRFWRSRGKRAATKVPPARWRPSNCCELSATAPRPALSNPALWSSPSPSLEGYLTPSSPSALSFSPPSLPPTASATRPEGAGGTRTSTAAF